jgi:hypothetical protein
MTDVHHIGSNPCAAVCAAGMNSSANDDYIAQRAFGLRGRD